jgi:hypothetical protein
MSIEVPEIGSGDHPKYIGLHYDERKNILLVLICTADGKSIHLTQRTMPNETIVISSDAPKAMQIGFRIAVNAMLSIGVHNDFVEIAPTFEQRRVKVGLREQKKSKDKFEAHRAGLRLQALSTHYVLRQKVMSEIRIDDPRSQRIPHIRQGHWRNQRYGKNRQYVRRVWIPEMHIHGDQRINESQNRLNHCLMDASVDREDALSS